MWNTVQDHKGTIHVKSSDTGTEFEIYFPVTEDQEQDLKKVIDTSKLQASGEKILVVDDEEHQREVAYTMLTAMGYDVECVKSGEEALKFLQEKKVDLVVLDMIMEPGLSGLMTYEEIIKIVPGQKAIIVSGFSENEEVKRVQQLGASKYIKKPFTYNQLGLTVKEVLS